MMVINDDEATIAMVDSNMQRDEILPSERAFSFKMKMDALRSQGSRSDLGQESTSNTECRKLNAAEEAGKGIGLKQVQL